MGIEELKSMTTRPAVHQSILGDYRGAYSLGVTRAPNPDGGAAFLVRVEGDADKNIPSVVMIEGEQVPVIVTGGFRQPLPL